MELSGGGKGIAIEVPVGETAASMIPKRLRKRMLELEEAATAKSPSTVQHIEDKLRLARLRRQQFYEKLSNKARPKPRSPSQTSLQEEDLGQRLEARLQAAEQKRLSILAKAQMRLAKLDELRQAAKTSVEKRCERERERLGLKVESRVQQAEENRMLILKAYSQRRASLKERTSQSLLRRIARESKYKERIRAAIHQKRVAAEKKRLGLLEAEKKRARARVLQVRRVANFVSHQREIESRKKREQLEDRLQRAKRQRAEYLRQRARQRSYVQLNWIRMHKQADLLSRKLARCWRQFLLSRRTTVDLVKEFDALRINEKSVKSMQFEHLARMIESSANLRTVKALLDRLESRLQVYRASAALANPSGMDNIDHLLKRVATPKKRTTPRNSSRVRDARKVGTAREANKAPAKLSRYPVRVFLCAYMILGHPDAVLSGQGEREIALAKSAEDFVQEFELLLRIVLDGPIQSSDEESDSMLPKRCTFRSQLAAFDKAWCSYLKCFVVWKVKDAESLEDDLVRAACQLELSMIQKCRLSPEGDNDDLTHDMKAIQKQVTEDQKLIREKVQHLSGDAGIQRMESALSETRSKYYQAKENGSPVGSPISHLLSSSPSSVAGPSIVAGSGDRDTTIKSVERPSHVVRSLFREEDSSQPKQFASTERRSSYLDMESGSSGRLITENEQLVNEFLHERHHSFVERFTVSDEDKNGIKAKIRETMQAAFWDSIIESMREDEPDFDRVIQLVSELRNEICEMAPKDWERQIHEAIDLDILSQVLKSGNLDIKYLGRILEFAMDILQKLSSPAQENEMKVMHRKLIKELADICQTEEDSKCSYAEAMIKGLRFVLEQIQALKKEISKARIMLMEPLLKGPAGLDYLRNAFAKSYGSYSNACTSLPLTKLWLSSVGNCKDQEWEEHLNFLSAVVINESSSQVPTTALRTGGKFQNTPNESGMAAASNAAGSQQSVSECNGEAVDLFVRLGLLKLVTGVSGLTQESLPETFMLNLSRLRAVQAQIQKIVVVATSILVCRQTLLLDRLVTSGSEMESVIFECSKLLWELLDRSEDVGIEEIVENMNRIVQSQNGETVNVDKLQSRKLVMARMLAKSLQAGDPVFMKVSRAVYVAARGRLLGGTGSRGRKLAEMAFQQIGAAMLTERVVEAAEVLTVAAAVSVGVHGPWYVNLIDNL